MFNVRSISGPKPTSNVERSTSNFEPIPLANNGLLFNVRRPMFNVQRSLDFLTPNQRPTSNVQRPILNEKTHAAGLAYGPFVSFVASW